MFATVELICNKVQGQSLRAAREIKIRVIIYECECESVSMIRIRSENAMNSFRILKFIFFKYMHVGTEFNIRHVRDVIDIRCKTSRERLMQMCEITEKLKQLKERCRYDTRIVHLIQKKRVTHMRNILYRKVQERAREKTIWKKKIRDKYKRMIMIGS